MNKLYKDLHNYIESYISKIGYDPELFLEKKSEIRFLRSYAKKPLSKSKDSIEPEKEIDDPVFGKITLDKTGLFWETKKTIKFITKNINICIGISTGYHDLIKPNKKQQQAFIWFNEHIDEINEKIADLVLKFIPKLLDWLREGSDDDEIKKVAPDLFNPTKEKLAKICKPIDLCITEKGSIMYECDGEWFDLDDHGMGILIKPKYMVDIFDAVEAECP